MPFNQELRRRLKDLKQEFDAGYIPKAIYDEMCRAVIAEFGDTAFESGPSQDMSTILTPNQTAILAAVGDLDVSVLLPFIRRYRRKAMKKMDDEGRNKTICPECEKEFLNTQGLSTHLLARHKKALDDYFFNPQTGRLTPKDRSTLKIPKAVEVVANSFDDSTAMSKLATAAAERSIGQGGDGIWLLRQAQEDSDGESASDSDEKSPTDEFSPRMTNLVAENSPDFDGQDEVSQEDDKKKDRRKYNKGMSHRNSYSKATKAAVISLRDQGKCTDEISLELGIPKSNIEKWCSAKGREKILRDHALEGMTMNNGSYLSSEMASNSLLRANNGVFSEEGSIKLPSLNNVMDNLLKSAGKTFGDLDDDSDGSTDPRTGSSHLLGLSSTYLRSLNNGNLPTSNSFDATNDNLPLATIAENILAPSIINATNVRPLLEASGRSNRKNNSSNSSSSSSSNNNSSGSSSHSQSNIGSKRKNDAMNNNSLSHGHQRRSSSSSSSLAAVVGHVNSGAGSRSSGSGLSSRNFFAPDDFSDSDDDNDVMGLLGEHRLTGKMVRKKY